MNCHVVAQRGRVKEALHTVRPSAHILAVSIMSIHMKPKAGSIQHNATTVVWTFNSPVHTIRVIEHVLLETALEVTILHFAVVIVH